MMLLYDSRPTRKFPVTLQRLEAQVVSLVDVRKILKQDQDFTEMFSLQKVLQCLQLLQPPDRRQIGTIRSEINLKIQGKTYFYPGVCVALEDVSRSKVIIRVTAESREKTN